MVQTDTETIRDVVAYSQRPLVTDYAVESAAIEFLLIVCGTNKAVYLEAKRQLQGNYFRDDEAILRVVWLAIDVSWQQFHGVTYETLDSLVRQEVMVNNMVLMQHHIDGLFEKSADGLLYSIANPTLVVTGANAELARNILRRFVIARGVFTPVRRIMQTAGPQQVPTDLYNILTSATRVHTQASVLSSLPVVDMAPEYGATMQTQRELTPTGVPFIDSAIGGQRGGEVGGILGPTGGGKTTFGVHMAVAHANLCWYQGQSAGVRPKCVVYVTAEESAAFLRPRVWSAFFRIQRDRAAAPDPFSNMTTQNNLLQYERDDQAGQQRILSERERYELRRPILNDCFAVLDLSGSAEFPHAGTGYVDEIEAHITRLIDSRQDQEIAMVVIDYAGLVVHRHMEFNSMDEKQRTPLLKYFADNCRQKIAERFMCPVWVLHQLNGAVGNKRAATRMTHTDAADSKSFAENMTVCGVLGTADVNNGCRLLNWSKTRNRENNRITPSTLKIHHDFSLMVDVSDQYVVNSAGNGFMSNAEAASVGAIQTLSRRGELPALQATSINDDDLDP